MWSLDVNLASRQTLVVVELARGLPVFVLVSMLVLHAGVQSGDLIWWPQWSCHFLLLRLDWLHQCPSITKRK